MSYIKFVLSERKLDSNRKPTTATISRIESDMADTSMLDTNLILHALSAYGGKVVNGSSSGFPYSFPLSFESD